MIEYTIKPATRPVVWIHRDQWKEPNGFYYDDRNGEIYELSEHQFVRYIGTIPNFKGE